jgi:hypothetical protein
MKMLCTGTSRIFFQNVLRISGRAAFARDGSISALCRANINGRLFNAMARSSGRSPPRDGPVMRMCFFPNDIG